MGDDIGYVLSVFALTLTILVSSDELSDRYAYTREAEYDENEGHCWSDSVEIQDDAVDEVQDYPAVDAVLVERRSPLDKASIEPDGCSAELEESIDNRISDFPARSVGGFGSDHAALARSIADDGMPEHFKEAPGPHDYPAVTSYHDRKEGFSVALLSLFPLRVENNREVVAESEVSNSNH